MSRRWLSIALAVSLLPLAHAFLPFVRQGCQPRRGERCSAVAMEQIDEELRQVEAMRVKQLKEELDKLGVARDEIDVCFEKGDLVQRLLDEKRALRQPEAPPTMGQTVAGMEMVMADEDGQKILEEMQQNSRLMEAAMDIATNGFSDKYEGDAEVMDFMQRLEAISKRQADTLSQTEGAASSWALWPDICGASGEIIEVGWPIKQEPDRARLRLRMSPHTSQLRNL
eukprot:CAMPEP_0119093146 /NCGR_PEP_ID=MMETSP1178-20130426/162166_1 /TAXON_ID=33656 /ORGANISM="unid sp, Strain CCMP2000" /LENGTH=225 /DNA_ID=CAMNT_0007076785 /DNA_START=39 /DNA_END=717 /DNA_ORIENTATION=+